MLLLILGGCASWQQVDGTPDVRPDTAVPGYAATWAGTYQGMSGVLLRGEPGSADQCRIRISIRARDERSMEIIGVVQRVRQTGGTASSRLVGAVPDDPRQLSGKMESDTGSRYSRQEYTLTREGTTIRGEVEVFELRSGPSAETYQFEVSEMARPGAR